MPLFSIVTVTLNPPEEDLRRTLDSVVGQDFEDWELIVKDGGSREGTLDGVPEDERIRVVTEEDSGIFDAMNQSLNHVRGRFICFLNAGDVFIDCQVLRAVAATAQAHEDAEFLYGDVAKPLSRSGFERYPERLSRAYLFFHMICHQVWFVSRSYYGSSRGYEIEGPVGKNPTGADYRFLLRMILFDQLQYQHVPKVLVSYQGGGVSQQPEQVSKAIKWVDEIRRELYSRGEYFTYKVLFDIRNVLKKTFYDRLGWRIWRRVRRLCYKI